MMIKLEEINFLFSKMKFNKSTLLGDLIFISTSNIHNILKIYSISHPKHFIENVEMQTEYWRGTRFAVVFFSTFMLPF